MKPTKEARIEAKRILLPKFRTAKNIAKLASRVQFYWANDKSVAALPIKPGTYKVS